MALIITATLPESTLFALHFDVNDDLARDKVVDTEPESSLVAERLRNVVVTEITGTSKTSSSLPQSLNDTYKIPRT
jgi:hypothetical protein